MSVTLQDLTDERMNQLLAEIVQDRITDVLGSSEPGHCLRISALPETVMEHLCVQFNSNGVDADVVLLLGPQKQAEKPWQVSASGRMKYHCISASHLKPCASITGKNWIQVTSTQTQQWRGLYTTRQ